MAYRGHYNNYKAFAEGKFLPLPITPIKAIQFIQAEMVREKKSKGSAIQGSTVSIHTIKQGISALEHFRKNMALDFPDQPDVTLRTDIDVRNLERACGANESECWIKAQVTKASGSLADNYTDVQKRRMSISFLQATTNSTKRSYDQVRNRAMDLCAGTINDHAWRQPSFDVTVRPTIF